MAITAKKKRQAAAQRAAQPKKISEKTKKFNKDSAEEFLQAARDGQPWKLSSIWRVRNYLKNGGLNTKDIGTTEDELKALKEKLIKEGTKKMEQVRQNKDASLLAILSVDLKEAGYDPELIGSTAAEMDELKREFIEKEDREREQREKTREGGSARR